jgi:choline kinase
MRKAIILAAGMGNRIAAMTGIPKPLLPLDGKAGGETFLDWHIRSLRLHGVEQIFIVGNTRTVNTPLAAAGDDVRWILNPTEDLSTSGSAHSAWLAFESEHGILDGASPVLLMDADIIYDPAVIGSAFDQRDIRSATLVHPRFDETSEEVLVYGRSGIPVRHGKGLAGTPLVEGLACFGEATGIVHLAPQDHADVRALTCWLMRYSTAKTRSEHEDITQKLMDLRQVVAIVLPGDTTFMEADFPEEYATLVKDVYPKLSAVFHRKPAEL